MDIFSYIPNGRRTTAVLACGGRSMRMGENKLLIRLRGKSCLRRSADALCSCSDICKIVVAAPEELWNVYRAELAGISLPVEFAPSGETRTESVRNAAALAEGDIILIHDGARPLVTPSEIQCSIDDAAAYGSSVVCTPVKDTVRYSDGEKSYSPSRECLYTVRTPQTFSLALYREMLKSAAGSYTDDAQMLDVLGLAPHITIGEYTNIKLTTPEDIASANAILGGTEMRIGNGYDVHKLVEGRDLIIGGVKIEYAKGLLGHSDADVLVHAVMDALLGAAAMGDIGKLFPDNDPKYSGADSLVLLKEVSKRLRDGGYEIGNIDATVIAQAPKLAPHIEKMRGNIAKAAGTDISNISVKATTEEGLGFSGRGEGIAAHAVAIII